ncbi:MAG: branched-chain amino acid ABC transporter permease, partial [Desulfofustis sp.]|nr:branched-chain amino acid ABC transporter permease [Desulfofustis sp.]
MRRLLALLPLVVLVVGVQVLTDWTDTRYYLTQLTMAAYYSLLIIGLCALMGYTGQISLGHAGFFAIGGYLSAALTTRNLAIFQDQAFYRLLDQMGILATGQDIYGAELVVVAPWAACLVAIVAAALIAWLLGIPVLKLKGHYLAMATLGFGIIIYRIVLASEYFGEADGISEVPSFLLPFGLEVSGGYDAREANYYIAWGLLITGLILLRNLVDSRVGRALR